MSTPDHRLDALKEAASQAKLDIGLFGAPLLLVLAQLGFLIQIEVVVIKPIVTIAVLALSMGLVCAWFMFGYLATWHAKELLCKEGPVKDGLGANLLHAVDNPNAPIGEDNYLAFRKRTHRPMLFLMFTGYLFVGTLVILLIWSTS